MPTRILNVEQKEAAQHGKGPLLIIAGAGTGKTTVITERIKYLILEEKINPSEILALTFTDKAAKEMEDRVDVALPYGYTQMWISTFHSFCERVLRQEAIHIGLDIGFRLMTEAQAILFLRKHIFQFDLDYFRPLGNPTKFLSGMIAHFSRLQDEDVSPEQYLKHAQEIKSQKSKVKIEDDEIRKTLELANAYKTYEDIKAKEGVMDFSDLISNALKLFRTRKNVLATYQNRFKYILVDEFQDVNFAQNELAILLAGERKNITVVGDDDQCLPGSSLIATPKGNKKIMDIKKGDTVLTGVGKGSLGISYVKHRMKNKKKTVFITIKTRSGEKLTVTANHKMFCYVPKSVAKKGYYYVYLMHKKNLGWRLGITNDLAMRLKLERSSDAIIGLRAFTNEPEARYHELLWALTYQIPTCIFKEREGVMLQGEFVKKLYKKFDTQANAKQLAKDLGIDLERYHYVLDGVTRGQSKRVKINLYLCFRHYTAKNSKNRILKNPSIVHYAHLETSNSDVIATLKKHNISFEKARKGVRVRYTSADINKVSMFANKLAEITYAFIEYKSTIGRFNYVHLPALIIPAGNLLEGHYVPILKNNNIHYDQIISITREEKEDVVYDLEIDRTHNFIANNILVHNSIYRFRGSSISNIMQFKQQFSETKIITLTKNYRSTQEILDHSYQLIQHNNPDRLEVKEKIDKKLVGVRGVLGEQVSFIYKDRVENEADEVAKTIKGLTNNQSPITNNYEYKDIAILVRANNYAEPFMRAFDRHKIPYQFLGPGQLFRQNEIKDLIAYLKVLANLEDSVALYRLLCIDYFAISPRDIATLLIAAKKKNASLFETIEHLEELSLPDEIKKKIETIVTMIHKHLKAMQKESGGQVLFYFLHDSGMLKDISSYKTQIEEKRAKNIAKFFDKLKTFETEHDDASVPTVVEWIDLSMQMGESPQAANIDWSDVNAVNILTIHSSKGLEFPIVFLVNLVAGRFPTRERREQIPIPDNLIKEILPEGDYHLEEERRLCYVGMTRAKDRLFLTASNYYGEGRRERKLSPFLVEALGEKEIEKEKLKSQEPTGQLPLIDFTQALSTQDSPITNYQLPITPINYLSYSQIDTFKMCPMHYKARYILKLPTPPSPALSFGSSVHATLRDYYQTLIAQIPVDNQTLETILRKNWVIEGYDSREHEQRSYQRAKRILEQYLKEHLDRKNLPLAVELPFMFRIQKKNRELLKIGGRIDRIDKLKGEKIEIIDYKTGKMPDEKTLKNNLQLRVYALAAMLVHDSILSKKPEDILLSLYYLEEQKKLSVTITQEQLEEAKEELFSVANQISVSDFTCSGSIFCENCEFKMLCGTIS